MREVSERPEGGSRRAGVCANSWSGPPTRRESITGRHHLKAVAGRRIGEAAELRLSRNAPLARDTRVAPLLGDLRPARPCIDAPDCLLSTRDGPVRPPPFPMWGV